jgi:hypothetical protein
MTAAEEQEIRDTLALAEDQRQRSSKNPLPPPAQSIRHRWILLAEIERLREERTAESIA